MRFLNIGIITVLIFAFAGRAWPQLVLETPDELRGIDVDEHLGEYIPLQLQFIDDAGEKVTLDRYFNQDKPVMLILGYYACPMLCNLVMNGVTDALKEIDWVPGNKFQIVSASIDTTETDVLARAKKANYLKDLGLPGAEKGWAFLTDSGNSTRQLAEAVGFKYYYVEERDEYAHPAVLVILTPDGKISRYLYGIQFKDFDLKMAMLEASEGGIGGTIDKIILYCYHYDPEAGSYTIFAGNLMRLGGGFTLAAIVIFLGLLWLRERRKKSLAAAMN